MYVRYIATIDETPLGLTALAFCRYLVEAGSLVRLVSTKLVEFRADAAWTQYAPLLLTPMVGDMVNVVCTDLASWERCHTVGVKNVLLIAGGDLASDAAMSMLDAAMTRYDATYTLFDATALEIERAIGRRPLVASATSLRFA